MLNISTLNVTGFVRATVHKDLSVLDEETDKALLPEELGQARKDAWLSINSDWCLTVGDKDVEGYIEETSRMQELVYRIHSYTYLVDTLRGWHYDRMAQQLRDEFGVDLDPGNKEQYAEDLDMVITLLKSDEIDLAGLQAMQEARDQQNGEGAVKHEPSEDVYDAMIWEIYKELFKQPALNMPKIKNEMMTKEFALAVKDLKQHYATKQPKMAIA